MGKDIFISYRRQGGEHLALLMYHQLRHDGYSVFLDVESLRKGKFDEALYTRIEECRDFILILPPHALDRCANPDDWVRQEIECAIRENKNIVPIMMEGFDNWPESLPETISVVSKFNGLKNHQGYFADMIRKLEKGFLESEPQTEKPAAPDLEEGEETAFLTKCKACGSTDVSCADPLPGIVVMLRALRKAIRLWLILAMVVFILAATLGNGAAVQWENTRILGISLGFLDKFLILRVLEFRPESLLHFFVVLAALLAMGNKIYQYTEVPPILEKETMSRTVSITCRKCDSKRRIRVPASLLPYERNEKSTARLGRHIFLGVTFLLAICYEVLQSINIFKDSTDKFIPILMMLALLAAVIYSRVNKLSRYLNAIPEKTFLDFLRHDFPMYEEDEPEETKKYYTVEPLEKPDLKLLRKRKQNEKQDSSE